MGGTRGAIIEIALAVAIVLAAVVARRERLGLPLLVLLSAVRPVADQSWEGKTLLPLSYSHGVTTADLLGVAGVALAAWLWFRRPNR